MCQGGKLAEEGSDLCELDFNECDLNPCPVGLTCVNQDNGYHCGCSDMGCEYDMENPSEVEEIDDSTGSTRSFEISGKTVFFIFNDQSICFDFDF